MMDSILSVSLHNAHSISAKAKTVAWQFLKSPFLVLKPMQH